MIITYYYTYLLILQLAHTNIQQEKLIPLYRYYNGIDHLYTTDIEEIGKITIGSTGNFGYKFEGIQCKCSETIFENYVPLYRYSNGVEHFYTIDENEIEATSPGTLGKNVYTREGIQCYVFRKYSTHTVPLYRYYNGKIISIQLIVKR